MMLDAALQLSSAQAVTTTAVSTNTLDLSVIRDIAHGQPVYVVFGVDESAAAAGAATVTFQAISAADAALSAGKTVLAQSDAIAKTELTAGRKLFAVGVVPAPLLAQTRGQRFLGVQYTVGTGPLTAGKFTAYLTDQVPPGVQVYGVAIPVA
jgi:hypothetical protein